MQSIEPVSEIDAAQSRETDRRAFTLQAEGKSAIQIAVELRISPHQVVRFANRHAKRMHLDKRRDGQRATQYARLEELYTSLRDPALIEGDLRAVQRLLEVLQAQRALLGLDAPRQVQVEHSDGQFEQFVRALKEHRDAGLALPEPTATDAEFSPITHDTAPFIPTGVPASDAQ